MATDVGANYSMKLERMRQMEKSILADAAEIKVLLDRLTQVLDVLQPQWRGASSVAYQRAQAEWTTSLAALNALLRRAATTSAGVVDRHLETRAEVAALWR